MLTQIKSNLLFTLKSEEFSPSNEQTDQILSLINSDGSFRDLDYTIHIPTRWCFETHIHRITVAAATSRVRDNEGKRNLLLTSLSYFLSAHRQNDHCWHNDIGLPLNMCKVYLLLEDYLSDQQKELILTYIKQGSIALHPNFLDRWHGTDLLHGAYISLCHAVIENNLDLMKSALSAVAKQLCLQNNGEGIQQDYSFFQQQTQLYNGGYGRSFVVNIAPIIYSLQKTEYQFAPQELSVLGYYIIWGTRFCIRNRDYDYLTCGSEIAHPNATNADEIRKAIWLLLKVEEMPCRDVMQEQLASFCAEGYSVKGDKFFNQSNYYVKRNIAYHIGCRGTSPLLSMGESMNNENMLSANLYAGGATCIMVTGKEYRDIFPLWDFARIPGTTTLTESDQQLAEKSHLWHDKTADNTYCKGICHNNYGLMYQDLNFNGVTGVIARFFVDDVMIALGAGLSSNTDCEVVTTLNQCHHTDIILTEQDGLPKNTVYQGKVGYASLDGQEILVESADKQCTWQRINMAESAPISGKICTFTLSHGTNPQNASYAYAVVPAVAPNSVAERLNDVLGKTEILRNDAKVQAIKYNGQVFAVFHENETLNLDLYDRVTATAQTSFIL